jgi:biofilm PGA synthesis N-glycosyltransferase PgaC
MLYGLFLALLMAGWRRKPKDGEVASTVHPFISVVVAVRNEAANIDQLLQDLLAQNYPYFEIIIVDDHSFDETASIINSLNTPLVKLIANDGTGKKAAITTGVNSAIGEIIATTDGDCRVPPNWLKSINDHFSNKEICMVIGAVKIHDSEKLFLQMQQIEFASLIGTSAATLQLGMPSMCNGANLAFRKNVFVEVNGYADNLHIASGDDEFLMRKVLKRYPQRVTYNFDCLVSTVAQPSISDFFQQRLRWAGKWRYNSSTSVRILAILILVTQLFVLCALYRIVNGDQFFLSLIVLKLVAEFFVLRSFCAFLRIRLRPLPFLLVQFAYPFYVIMVGFLSFFLSFRWKERKYEKA